MVYMFGEKGLTKIKGAYLAEIMKLWNLWKVKMIHWHKLSGHRNIEQTEKIHKQLKTSRTFSKLKRRQGNKKRL